MIIIRKAKKEDFDQIHKLIKQVHDIHVNEREDIYKNVDPITRESFIEDLLNINNIYIVAEENNVIVGICLAELKEITNNKIMKDRKIINIGDICVDKEKRKQGIGKQLYNEIIKYAEESKVDSVELMVWGFNKNAIDFYENIGMEVKNIRFEHKI